ncbi:hypothetical protein ACFQFH_01660 [Halobaculum halobium]|uniref:DUF362 domain-containing protein n=1 Tax=Halobaculum halobium TaxID=3032281 RepID=A0ABD5TB34_9EURY|nr:hypothetical protein [Halobaculum sp. SYNS20]
MSGGDGPTNERASATPIDGVRTEGRGHAAIAEAVERLSLPDALDDAGLVLLLPDTGYPHHPSTGAVTDPTVVRALASHIRRTTGTERVLVGVAGDGQLSDGQIAELLGYGSPARDAAAATGRGEDRGRDAKADRDADVGGSASDGTVGNQLPGVIAREQCQTTDQTVETHLGPVDAAVPRVLEAATVVVVPSLRVAPDLRLAGAGAILGRWITGGAPTAREAAAGLAAVDPVGAVLDATTAYVGHPLATDTLLCGESAAALDATAASLFGWNTADVPFLSRESTAAPVTGIDTRELGRSLPDDPDDGPTGPTEAMATAYRTYARATGDVVPPQFLSDDV